MKGLHGGIPIAVLAAVAKAQVIGGPTGNDGPDGVAYPIHDSYSSTVQEWNKDNHDVHIENKFPPPPPPHHPHPGPPHGVHPGHGYGGPGPHGGFPHHARGVPAHEDTTLIGGPSGPKKPGHSEVIGGPSGDDHGQAAAIPIENSYSSSVKDSYKDDHHVDIKHEHEPWPRPPFHPGPPHHHWARGEPKPPHGDTIIGGPSGDDGGNTAAIPITDSYSSDVKDWYKDDHSVDVKHEYEPWARPPFHPGPKGPHPGPKGKGPHPGPPSKHHWARSGPPHEDTVIGGPSGDDGGNVAAIPITASYDSSVKDWYKDDHSVDVKHEHEPWWPHPHAPHHHWARGGPPPHEDTIIGGPSGDDGGNAAAIPIEGDYSSSVKDWYKDDHSVDVKHEHEPWWPHPEFWPGPPHGPKPHGHPGPKGPHPDGKKPHYARGVPEKHEHPDATLIDGPSGDDEGNVAAIPIKGEYSSDVKDSYKDDHSVDIEHEHEPWWPHPAFHPGPPPPHGHPGPKGPHPGPKKPHPDSKKPYHARGFPEKEKPHDTTVIGGPSGDDEGNVAAIPIKGDYSSSVKDWYKDDHSVDVKEHWDHPHPKPHHPHWGGPGPHGGFPGGPGPKRALRQPGGDSDVIGGPSGDEPGNVYAQSYENEYDSDVKSKHNDDHSVKATIPHYDVVPPPHPEGKPKPDHYETKPDQYEPKPKNHHEPEHAPESEHSTVQHPPAVMSNEDQEDGEACSTKVKHIVHTVTQTKFQTGKATTTSKPTTTGKHTATGKFHDPQQAASSSALYHQPQSAYASPQPSLYHSAQSSSSPTTSKHLHGSAQAEPSAVIHHQPQLHATTPSASVSHGPLTSSVTVKHASTYAVIPVHVPYSSAASSVKIYASESPYSTPSPNALPSGASPKHFSPNSAKNSTSHGIAFTGGASRLTAGAGIVSVLCGLVAVAAAL